jgi:hypothetical protein
LADIDSELYRRVDEVLHYVWDPCSIADAPQARDEYYGYLPQVFALLQGGASAEELAQYLASIEQSRMDSEIKVEALLPIGELLVVWREHLASTPNNSFKPKPLRGSA